MVGKKRAQRELLEAELHELEAKIEVIKAKVAQTQAADSIKVQEQLERLHEGRGALGDRMDELRDASEGAWEEAGKGVQNAWEELKDAYEDLADGIGAAVTRFKGTGH